MRRVDDKPTQISSLLTQFWFQLGAESASDCLGGHCLTLRVSKYLFVFFLNRHLTATVSHFKGNFKVFRVPIHCVFNELYQSSLLSLGSIRGIKILSLTGKDRNQS